MDFWACLDAVHARHNVLEHPFYKRWSSGQLTRPELAHYAGQYRYAVLALASAAARAAASVDVDGDQLRAQLAGHAHEESEHIALWDDFCSAVGGSVSAAPAPETLICARTWAGDAERPLAQSLIALYAVEAAQPSIAATKRTGLTAHYGLREGPATAYFKLHERLDVEHAAASRELIEGMFDELDSEALLVEAEAALRANWLLLDGMERSTAISTCSPAGFK